MKIIFVCTRSLTFNTFLKSQADFMLKKGFKVKIACSDVNKINLKKKITREQISFPCTYFDLLNILNYLKIFFQIKNLVKKNKSSIFYIHTPVAAYIFRLFTFFNRIKVIYFVHGFRFTDNTSTIKSLIFKFIEILLSRNTSLFITINSEDYNFIKKKIKNKSLIYRFKGVGVEKQKRNKFIYKDKILKILVISSYKKEKGYNELLKVAEYLEKKNIKIICYGYGNHESFNQIKKKKKLRNIFFKKFDKSLKHKIKKFDLLLHLSEREGLPVSLIESLQRGVPVICKKIRGNTDLIKNNYNGFFVDSAFEAYKKILYLNLDLKKFNNLRKNATRSIDNSYLSKYINLKLYKLIKFHYC